MLSHPRYSSLVQRDVLQPVNLLAVLITQHEALTAAAAMQNRSAVQSLNGEVLVERVPPAD